MEIIDLDTIAHNLNILRFSPFTNVRLDIGMYSA